MGASGLGTRDIIGSFYHALDTAMKTDWIGKVGMLISSDQASETYKWLGQTPAFREWLGSRNAIVPREMGQTIINKLWEATLGIKIDDFRRDKTGQIQIRINEMAKRAANFWRARLLTYLLAGKSATKGLCYDGQYYFDIDHSEGKSGTQLNLLAAAQVSALNVTTVAAPTAAEAVQAILGVIGYMLGYKDDQGEYINEDASQFLVMCGTGLMGPFQAAINNPNVDSGQTNTIRSMKGDLEITLATSPRLSSWTDQFMVFRTDGSAKAMIMQEETGVEMEVLGPGSEHAFKNNEYLFGAKFSGEAGFGLWQYAAHATLS